LAQLVGSHDTDLRSPQEPMMVRNGNRWSCGLIFFVSYAAR